MAVATRLIDALAGPVLRGDDAIGHVSYAFFLDLYHAVPLADQGWSYFHPPLHYAVGWLLAQTGSPGLFVRGLALWNAAAGLGVAALTAALVRRGLPGRAGLASLAFAAVAFLPVLIYATPTPGNEISMTLAVAAALTSHLANRRGSLGRDALTGLLAGAALLAKYSGCLALLAVVAQLALGGLRKGRERRRAWLRIGVVAGVALLLAGPYYARNVSEFGTPFPLAGHRPVVDAYESLQPPGERGWRDWLALSPRLFADPSPLAPHMIHSVWGSLYASAWVRLDRNGSALPPRTTRALLALGVLPTLLAGAGLLLCAVRAARDPQADVEVLLVLLTAGGLAGFVLFAAGTPTFAALKALYLLNLAPAYGYFVARGAAALPGPALRGAAGAGVAAACLASAWAYTPGLGLPGAPESVQMAAVRSYFGDWEGARRVYRRELEAALRPPAPGEAPGPSPFWAWGMLAGVELAAGRAEEARALYAESFRHRPETSDGRVLARASPWVLNRLAVATALAGDRAEAARLLDGVPEPERPPELRVNRAALLALDGDLAGAEAELRRALADLPQLAPALADLAWVHASRGERDAAALRRAAERASLRPPRHYPYWVGDGRGLNTQIFMLVLLRGDGLALYRPGRARSS